MDFIFPGKIFFFFWLSLRWICQRFLIKRKGVNIIQFHYISVNFNSMCFLISKLKMLELRKIFLILRFFNRISCNKGLKGNFFCFIMCFFCLTPQTIEGSRIRKTTLRSWSHIGWRNTKICIHRASRMERKWGKCGKLPIFEGKLWVFVS